ncbi:MAG: phosphatase PAP2 family protein [Clostridia bacterium]|nr:phosphatase PAP2 family protein [Clostridia bacterium]
MEKKNKKRLVLGAGLVVAFVLWTVLVCFVDVRTIGPEGSSVGFATLNGFVHELTGVNWLLYTVTDWLGLVPIAVALGFAILGLVQLIKRKSLWKVDHSILALGVFYIVVMAAYLVFEIVVINYRPTLIEGYLEASYPSSTTMLVMCVMPTAAMQLNARIKNTVFRRCVIITIIVFIAFMVIGRLVSGVHWITDIIGGALFSAGVVTTYFSICNILK